MESSKINKSFSNIFKVAKFSLSDELHQKSLYIFIGISILLIVALRGCFNGEYFVNGSKVDTVSAGWHASIAIFHFFVMAGMFVGSVLAMRSIRHDQETGLLVMVMSKSVHRWEYVVGKILAIWIISTSFMFLLHLTVYLLMWSKTGGRIPNYLTASLLGSLSILCVISLTTVLSILVTEIVALLGVALIAIVSYISDSVYALTQVPAVKSLLNQTGNSAVQNIALWKKVWPKFGESHRCLDAFIKEDSFTAMTMIHPLLNISIYAIMSLALLLFIFQRREIR